MKAIVLEPNRIFDGLYFLPMGNFFAEKKTNKYFLYIYIRILMMLIFDDISGFFIYAFLI